MFFKAVFLWFCVGANLCFPTWFGEVLDNEPEVLYTDISSGYLSAYDYLPTVATIANRQKWGQIPQDLQKYDGVIAVLDCGNIGREAVLESEGLELYVIVFDCAGIADGGAAWMVNGNYVAEVGYGLRTSYPNLIGKMATLKYVGTGFN